MFPINNSFLIASEVSIFEFDDYGSLVTRYEINSITHTEKIDLFTANKTRSRFAISHVGTDSDRQLVLLNENFCKFKCLKLKRAANLIEFLNDNIVIFVDKNGEVFQFDITTDTTIKLFGHCSLIIDLVISPLSSELRYIISGDRDEKIRVSNYPNTYDIQTYCLGHRKFVSRLAFYRNKWLISACGGGELFIWNYVDGKILKKHALKTDPIVNFELSDDLIAIETQSCNNSKNVSLYLLDSINFAIKYVQDLTIDNFLLYKFHENQFLIATKVILFIYEYKNENCKFELIKHLNFGTYFNKLIDSRMRFDLVNVLMKKCDDIEISNKRLKI